MKRILFYITILISFICTFMNPVMAETLPIKVTGMNYDTFGALISISTLNPNSEQQEAQALKCVRLSNPNRVYFDINNAVLIGEKQQILFEKSVVKEFRLAQFETNPYIVRAVVTFEEDFDSTKINPVQIGGNIIITVKKPVISNDYFNVIYDEALEKTPYSGLTASSQVVQKVSVPVTPKTESESAIKEIEKAFEASTLSNSDGKTYDTIISLDMSSKLKLRTKYYINQYIPKNNGLLVSGIGQLTTGRMFWLSSPKRAVIDLPNTYLDKAFRNREVSLCPDGACTDTAKIGQFDFNTARIVISSENAEKYIPVYSKDSQSLFIVNSDKLNHTILDSTNSNLNKTFVKRTDSKSGELILSFTQPVVHSIVRTENAFSIYLFNVKNYNDQDFAMTVANTPFKNLSISLLPQTGIRATAKIGKKDFVKVEESIDGKAIKIILKRDSNEDVPVIEKPSKKNSKGSNKVVLDPGHGGSDYGAIREGVNEKDITLDISQRVEAILRSKGYKVALTRSDDSFVSLEDRVAFSENESPEIFVSIHVNSAVSETPNGIETHWYHDYSKSLAEVIHKHFIKEFPNSNDRGLFKSKFYVINHTTSPAVLCEIGFLSNPEERNDMITDARKQKTAKAIADGIIEYMKGSK